MSYMENPENKGLKSIFEFVNFRIVEFLVRNLNPQ